MAQLYYKKACNKKDMDLLDMERCSECMVKRRGLSHIGKTVNTNHLFSAGPLVILILFFMLLYIFWIFVWL